MTSGKELLLPIRGHGFKRAFAPSTELAAPLQLGRCDNAATCGHGQGLVSLLDLDVILLDQKRLGEIKY